MAEVEDRSFERRTAQAMVATFLQMGRSAHLARWLHQARQRSLEKRVRAATEMKEIVGLQRRLDAQQSQAAVVEQAATRFRNRARELAQFARAGLTMEDFHRMGVQHVVDVEQFNAEVAKVQQEMVVPASPPESPPDSPPAASAGPPPPARIISGRGWRRHWDIPKAKYEWSRRTWAAPLAAKTAATRRKWWCRCWRLNWSGR